MGSKRYLVVLLVVVCVWELLRLPAVSNALFMFVVLGINPFTNHTLSFAAMLTILTVGGISSAAVLFSEELATVVESLFDWTEHEERELRPVPASRAKRQPLTRRQKPGLSLRTKHTFTLRYGSYDIRPILLALHRMIASVRLPRSLQEFRIPSLSSEKLAGIVRTVRRSALEVMRMLRTGAVHVAMTLTAVEMFCARMAQRGFLVAGRGCVKTGRAMYIMAETALLWTMVLAGYLLLGISILGLTLWRYAEPYIRRADQLIAEAVHGHEGTDVVARFGSEISRMFLERYRELRNIRHSILR